MDNTNKPQWLIDAENEINQYAETKLGKMSQEEFKFFERQSNAGKSGGSSRSNKMSKDELTKAASLAGSASAAARKANGTFKDFQSNAGKAAWENDHEGMLSIAKKALVKAGKVAYKRTVCSSCGKEGSKATTTRNHKLDKNGKCKFQVIYKDLPLTFTKKDIKEHIKNIPTLIGSETRIKILYKPKCANQHNPTIYCKQEDYDCLIKDFETKKNL